MFGFRPCAPCCRGVCPEAGVCPPAGGVASLARRQGCGFAAPLVGDFLRYISDFLRYISPSIFWIIADNLLPLGMI